VIFVLEGPDLAGKSTLADELEKQYVDWELSVTRMKRGPLKPSQDPLTEYLVPLQDYDGNGVWVLDRWHLGELVYGELLRGASRLSLAQAHYVELALRSLGGYPVHVTTTQEILARRYSARGDDLVNLEQLLAVRDHYNSLVFHHMPWYVNVYTDVLDARQHAYGLTTARKPFKMSTPYLRWTERLLPAAYLGGPRPKVLLLGDRQAAGSATRRRPDVVWPFAPWNGTSGHWLFQSLLAADVRIYDVGVINACDRPPIELLTVWHALDQPPTIALGLNAKKSAESVGIPLANHIPHPQFARRFHHKDLVPYGLEIKKVMK
jgi:hypothetical protein